MNKGHQMDGKELIKKHNDHYENQYREWYEKKVKPIMDNISN